MPTDPVICAVCGLVFEHSETKPIGKGHRVDQDCWDENDLADTNARENLLFDLTEETE